ncbi:hypothetical protein V2J09_002019 [Rumex salicifolius]
MDDCNEASLLRKLESSDYTSLHDRYSQYLEPLTLHLLNPQIPSSDAKKVSKSKSNSTPSSTSSTIRSLLKSYLPFLNRSLSLLPKCLTDSPKPSAAEAAELFDTYRLCLDCIGCFTSLLSCKPYTVHLQTSRLVRCLVEWGRYSEAMDEGFRVLRAVSEVNLDGILDSRESFVPVLVDGSGVDADLAYLVVEVFLRVLQCVSMSKTKEEVEYHNLLAMLKGIQPWLRVLDTSVSHKFKRMLVSYLNKATRFLAKLGADLLPKFCAATFDEYQKLLVEQAVEVDALKLSTEFLELLSCCAYECRASCIGIHGAVAASMVNMEVEPFEFISRLYACGLHLSGSRLQINWNADSTTLGDNSQVQALHSLLSSAQTFCAVYLVEKSKDKKVHADETRRVFLKFYLDALKFLCRPLADFVNSERKSIINEVLDSHVESYLQNVQKSFCHLIDILFPCKRYTTITSCHYHLKYYILIKDRCSCSFDTQRDGSEAIDKTVLKVSVASLALSLKLNLNMKRSCEFLQFLLSETNLQYQEMKYILVSLYDIGLDCYRNKQLKESIKTMELCYEASWTCGLKLCQKISGKEKPSTSCLSEDAISDIATKAAMATSFFLDILFEENSHRLGNAIVYSLRKWSTMRDLFEKLPSPQSFVRQWVKIQVKLYKKADDKKVGPTLYTYLMDSVQGDSFSSLCVSKGTITIILEQELAAFQEMSDLCPEFCGEMGMKIIDLLLHNVHVTKHDWFEKSKFLIMKGRLFRESGTEFLKDSIHCLSEAIDTIIGATGVTHQGDNLVSNQLAVAYSLRALSIHEAEPSSKVQEMKVLGDIQEAVKIWLSSDVTLEPSCHLGDRGSTYILQLLYHFFDLLSLKGNIDPNICKLLIKAFNAIDKPLDKCLLMLWESRRLSHSLCVSPINELFLVQLSEEYGDIIKSVKYWLSCMKDSQTAILGFKQNFSILCTQFPQASGLYQHILNSNILVDDVKEAAQQLFSSGRNDSAFVVGCLYYDLAERLLSTGQLIEALHWAKEAHQLRCKLLQEHFSYMLEYQEEKYSENGDMIRNQPVCAKYLKVCTHKAIKVWDRAALFDSGHCKLTPWKVLECYLESTLQVGIIQEVIGNGTEAEALFSWGKSISCLQGLPLFTVAFSAGLGKVYYKMRLWDFANKELQSAKKVLHDSSDSNVCLRCHLMMESNVDDLLANLYRSRCDRSGGNSCMGPLSVEENYKSALAILNSSEWKGTNKDNIQQQISVASKAPSCDSSNIRSLATDLSDSMKSCSIKEQGLEKKDKRRFTRKKKESSFLQNGNCQVTEQPSRMTRSRNLSSKKECDGEREVLDVPDNKCMKCLYLEDRNVDSFTEFIHIKWEFGRRKQLLRVLIDLVERAAVLYNVCWFSLKNVVPRERSSSPELHENHWAAYFHQASVSARHNHWVLSHLSAKQKHITDVLDPKDSQVHDKSGIWEDMRSLFRLAPDSTQSVTEFIKHFFDSLPTTTIVCLSILGGSYASVLKALVPLSSSCSWMLLSRFNANSEPVVVLLPLNIIDKDTELPTYSSERSSICSSERPSVVDEVAPTFKSILLENKSSSVIYSEDTAKNRSMWWGKRKGLDRLLSKLLIEMEESWLGPWKYLVLGQWSENQALESAAMKLAGDLKRKCDFDVKVSLLKAVLGAVKFASQEEVSIPRIVLEKGCYVGTPGECDEARYDVTDSVNRYYLEHISRVGFELMLAAVNKFEEEHGTSRESVILVLDSEVQMLPWENVPILREQEVYRMPSISCISAILQKTRPQQGSGVVDDSLPLIDPLDAFYLVNPSGDLGATQAEFEEWFRGQNLEGKAGTAPSSRELSDALNCHDVFLYFGHGSGAQYIPTHEIQKLEKCAACVLMGCSSGSIQMNGSYTPRGIVYSYISAGSPVVIANLWEVTDKDIDRFGRAVLEAWFTERSNSLSSCVQCSMLAEEVNAITLNKKTRNSKKGKGKKQIEVLSDTSSKNWCRHKVKVGYFVSKARNACKLPYLIGAAPVCYGVPTGIRKKNDY